MANEIHLNNAGINSISTPVVPLQVLAGTSLRLKLVNHGAPIHLTLTSSNASPFSDFSHQNIYVREEVIHEIPIHEDAFPGLFDLTVVTGYGTVRASFQIQVLREPERQPEPPGRPKFQSIVPEDRGLPPVVLLFAGAGVVLYLVWWATRLEVVNFAAFALLMAGLIVGWLIQRS